MKVLLTGGHGMVGKAILAHPLSNQLHIDAPGRAELDLRRKDRVVHYLRERKPDLIIHAAGRVGGIKANIADPYAFLLENLEVGTNVIAAADEVGIQRLLNLGSSCIYPRDVEGLLTEDLILTGPLEPTNEGYALGKLAALKLCQFASAGGRERQYKTLIPCNLFGPHDKFDLDSAHLIPAVIHKIHRAKVERRPTVEIWGDGSARREFMYVGDLAQAVLKAALDFDRAPDLMNVGLGQDKSVLEYYEVIAEVVGWKGEFTFDLAKPAGMRRKVVDISRQTAWGWRASSSLEDGIKATYGFFLRTCAT